MTAQAAWHIYFDGDLNEVVGHLCDLHRAVGDSLPPCDDRQPDGDCSHVQIRGCMCSVPPDCDGCKLDEFDAGETTSRWAAFAAGQRTA